MNETEGMPGYVWWTYARRADAYVANSIHHTHTYFIFFLYVSCPFALLLLCHRKRRPTERSHKGQCASVSSFFSTWLCFIAAVKWDKKQHTKVFFYYFAFCARWTNINFFFVRVVVYVFFRVYRFIFNHVYVYSCTECMKRVVHLICTPLKRQTAKRIALRKQKRKRNKEWTYLLLKVQCLWK